MIRHILILAGVALCSNRILAAEPSIDDLPKAAANSLRRAVDFYHHQAARHGGYVYRYSADLAKTEGEGKTGPDTIWVQPPGTPSVGEAFVLAYQRTHDPACPVPRNGSQSACMPSSPRRTRNVNLNRSDAIVSTGECRIRGGSVLHLPIAGRRILSNPV